MIVENKEIKNIALIPVIELEPFSYSDNYYKLPNNSVLENPEEWEIYNQKRYCDSGLTDITPIEKGSWLFEIDKLNDENLKIVLSKIFEERLSEDLTLKEMLEDMSDFAPLISGGYVLNIEGENVVLPGCCCDLETIHDWYIDFDLDNSENSIWVGHDSGNETSYKIKGKNVIIIINDKHKYLISVDLYEKMLEECISKLELFIERMSPIINEILNIDLGDELANQMVFRK